MFQNYANMRFTVDMCIQYPHLCNILGFENQLSKLKNEQASLVYMDGLGKHMHI